MPDLNELDSMLDIVQAMKNPIQLAYRPSAQMSLLTSYVLFATNAGRQ